MKNTTPEILPSRAIGSNGVCHTPSRLFITLASLLATLSLSHAANFDDGGTHTLNDASLINDVIEVSNNTTLNIGAGAVIEGTVRVHDSSSLNVSGGQFGPTSLHGRVYLYDTSNALVTGGTFGGTGATSSTGGILVFGDSVLTIEGGDFGVTGIHGSSGYIRPSGNSLVNISGGTFGGPGSHTGSIQASGDSVVNITGGTFGTGTGVANGIFSLTYQATVNISGGVLLPRTDGASHGNIHSADALITVAGCAFTTPDGTPLPFGLQPNTYAFRFNATLDTGDTFQIRMYAYYANTVRLDYVPCNEDPVADAGPDQTAECAGLLTTVQLDGSASSDPDGDTLSYEWAAPVGVTLDDPNIASPSGDFPIGPSLLTLTVADGNGGVSCDDVLIIIQDTTAPVVVCTTDVIALHAPNHTMRTVQIGVAVTEECSDFALSCEVSSSEPDDANGDGAFTGDVDGLDGYTLPVTVDLTFDAASNAFIGEVELRAERDGAESGRSYSIVCDVADFAGNVSSASCVVVVPHDRRKAK